MDELLEQIFKEMAGVSDKISTLQTKLDPVLLKAAEKDAQVLLDDKPRTEQCKLKDSLGDVAIEISNLSSRLSDLTNLVDL